MKLICPHCQSSFSLEEAAKDVMHHEIASLAAKFGPGWQFAQGYVDCFRQSQFGRIRLEKRLLLLKEVWAIIAQERFEFKGHGYRTSHAAMKLGMYRIIKLDKWGLKNHNYLKQVLITDGAEVLSAEGLTAGEERERERRKAERGPRNAEPATMTAEEYKRSRGIESLAEGVGKKVG